MKKKLNIFRIFLSLILILSFVMPAYAQIEVNVDVDDQNVMIHGSSNYMNQPISIKTEHNGQKLHINTEMTDEKGNFYFKFPVETKAKYKGYLNIEGEKKEFFINEDVEDQKSPENVEVTCEKVDSKEVTLKLYAKDLSGIDYYKIFRDNFEKEINISKTNTYIDKKVEPNKTYQYKIKAVDTLGNESEFSNLLEVTTLADGSGNGDSNVKPPDHKSIKVNIRVEGNKDTIIHPTKIYLSENDLDLKNYGISRTYKDYMAIHPTIKALENEGKRYTCDNTDYNFITMIDGLRKGTVEGGKDGWMYYVDHQYADYGVSEYPIHDGDRIVWFFGENYKNNWYTWFEQEEIKVKTGEKVTLKLRGSHYDMDTKKTSTGNVQGANILVEDKKYKLNGEEVKTDQEGKAILKFNKAGTYHVSAERFKGSLRDISRPYCKVVVEGSTISGGNSGISNEDYEKEYNTVIDQNSSEKDVTNAVKEATNKLDKKANEIKSEKDAQIVVKDAKDVAKIIEKAADRVITEEGAKKIAKNSIEAVNSLVKSAEKLSKDSDKEELGKAAKENMKSTIKAIDKMKNIKEINKVAGDMIDTGGKLIKNIGNEKGQEVIESTIKIAEKAVEKASVKEFDKNKVKVQVQDNKAVVEVDGVIIKEMAQNTVATVKVIKEKLNKNSIKVKKALKNKITIEVPKVKQKEVQAVLPANIMKIVKENGIEKLAIQTENAVFNVTPNTLIQKEQEIALSVKTIDRNDLTALEKNKVPKGCVVVDVNANIGEEKISKFNKPMEVSIPYKGVVKKGEVVQVFYLKDNGTIENMGGVYDPTTKLVTFEASHFSKYFAKKVEKEEIKVTFNDLADYEWAKEAIEEMANKGIIKGRSEGVFDPDASITRAEFATLITKMLGFKIEDININFIDVEDTDWYTPYIKTAYKNGLISGRSKTVFDPNGNITREEMATIIGKVLTQKGKEKANNNELERFIDKTNIASWANENVALCVKENIISGMPDHTFMPKENANRAQAAVMLYKLYKSIE